MFFREKVHPFEIVKWGVFAGVLEGLFLMMAAVLYAKQSGLAAAVAQGDVATVFLLLSLLSLSAIATSVIVFAHPIYCLLRKQYRDALLMIAVTFLTLLVIVSLSLIAYQAFFVS